MRDNLPDEPILVTTLFVCAYLGVNVHAGNIVSSILTSTTDALVDNPRMATTPSTPFDMEKELAKIATACLTPRDHEQLSGNLLRQGYALGFNWHLIEQAEEIIGVTEMRAALGFSPPGPWQKYRGIPSASQLAAASTIEEYFELREPSSEDRSLDNYFFFEHNLPPVIAFLDARFPNIRMIFKQKFDEILRHDSKKAIDRKMVDRFIDEYYNNILPRLSRATDEMYHRSNECRRLSEERMKMGPKSKLSQSL